jgi:hypothetical protein
MRERLMRDRLAGATERPTGPTAMSPSEKLACEWEARHDVAARSRRVDPATALDRYLTRTRLEEGRRHQEGSAERSEHRPARRAEHRDQFAAQHPLAASWLRWGEDPR